MKRAESADRRGAAGSPAEGGFTLLEIVIALAIAALGIAAVAKATGSAATVADETRERMLAVWVAGNRLSELRITRAWPAPGGYDAVRNMGGRSWYLTQTVSPTGNEDVRRVDIDVYSDARRSNREFAVHGYLARYREAEAPEEDGDDGVPGEEPGADQSAGDLGTPLPGEEQSEAGREQTAQDNQPSQDGGTGGSQ
jgi:general secretion pathway protein I